MRGLCYFILMTVSVLPPTVVMSQNMESGVSAGRQLDYFIVYSGNDVVNKTTFVYNENGLVKESIVYRPNQVGELTYNSKEIYDYDGEGRVTFYESYVWDAFTASFIGNSKVGSKKDVAYDNDGKIDYIDYYKWDNNIGAWLEHVYMHGDFVYDGLQATETRQKWLNDSWVDSDKYEYLYDENSRIVEEIAYTYSFDFSQGGYVYKPADKTLYAYDEFGNITEQASYFAGYEEDSWSLATKIRNEYTYDEYNNILTKNEYTWRDWLDDWQLSSSLVYDNHYVSSDYLDLPYSNDFNSQSSIDGFVVDDGNSDGDTWRLEDGSVVCSSSVKSEAPEILYTPALYMTTGYEVKITFKVRVADVSHPSNMQLILCSNDEKKTPMGPIGDIVEVSSTEYVDIERYVIVPNEGPYCIGICFDNNLTESMLYLDDLEAFNYRSSATPQPPYSLQAIAANDASLQVQLDFYAPRYTIDGNILSHVDKMEVYRNDSEYPVYVTGEVGATLVTRWVDTDAERGKNVYKIYAYSDSLRSDAAAVSVVVGYSRPGIVKNLSIKEDNNHNCILSWERPDGMNGGELYDGPIYYTVIRNNEYVIAEATEETTVIDNSIDVEYGQVPVYYRIIPTNESGEGEVTYSDMLFVGEPLGVPFVESFAGGGPVHYWMNDKISGLDAGWGIGARAYAPDAYPQDNDGGMASFMSTNVKEGTITRFTNEKIDISTLESPVVSFFVYHTNDIITDDALVVEASADNGDFIELTDEIHVSGAPENGWKRYVLPLDDFKGTKGLRLGFKGISGGVNNVHLDNIVVADESDIVGLEYVSGDDGILIYSYNGSIIVKSFEECEFSVFSIRGELIYRVNDSECSFEVDPGMYLVKCGNVISKVFVH